MAVILEEPRWDYACPTRGKIRQQVGDVKKVRFGYSTTYTFPCDAIYHPYDYHPKLTNEQRLFVITKQYLRKSFRHAEIAQILGSLIADQVARCRICTVAKDTKWIIDSGSGLRLVISNSLNKKDKLAEASSPVTMATASGFTTAQKEWKGYVPGLKENVDAIVLENSPCNVLSLGKLCTTKGYFFAWDDGKLPTLRTRDGRNVALEVQSFVPAVTNVIENAYVVQEAGGDSSI